MGHGIIGVNVLTWTSQAASVPAIIAAPTLPWLLVVLDMWHFGVFATTGIFFWKWMVVNAGFVAALRQSEKPVPMMIRISSLYSVVPRHWLSISFPQAGMIRST